MAVHERAVGATVEWLTPPTLFARLGIKFDFDPCGHPNGCVPAWDVVMDGRGGLDHVWHGRVWLNPPYGPQAVPFVNRMIEHANGILLVAARTETRWFQRAAKAADIVCFLRDRLHFINATTGYQSRSSFASVLLGWGDECVAAIRRADLGLLAALQTGYENTQLSKPE